MTKEKKVEIRLTPELNISKKPGEVVAEIVCLENLPGFDTYGYKKGEERVATVAMAENVKQWRSGVIRINIEGKEANLNIDVLMRAIFAVYSPDVLRRTIGIIEQIAFKAKSNFLKIKIWLQGMVTRK